MLSLNHVKGSGKSLPRKSFRIEALETRRLLTAVLSGQLVQSSLSSGTQQNAYTFPAIAGGTVELSAGPVGNSNGLEIGMDLYDPNGTLLKTVSSTSGYQIDTISASAGVSGTYTAVIRSVNNNGGYFNFSAAALPGPQSTGQLASDQGVSGNINGQLDVYSVTAAAGGTVSLSAGPTGNSNGLEIGIDLFSPTGALLNTSDASRAYQIVTVSAVAPTSGTYYAVVRSASGYGSYNFSAVALPAAQVSDPLDSAGGAITSGQSAGGYISGQLDAFSFSAVANGAIELSSAPTGNSNGLNIGMDLYTPGGTLLNSVNASSGAVLTLAATAPTTGTFYAIIRSDNGNGGSYEFSEASIPAVQSTGLLASDQGVSGYIGGQLNTYSFSATAGGTVEVSAGPTGNSNGLEIGMDLFGPNGTLLSTINASRGYQIVTLSTNAPSSGTYYVVIRSANGAGGGYNFSPVAVPAQQVSDPIDSAGGPIVSGQAVDGLIAGQVDAFNLAAIAGGTIELSAAPTGNSNGLNIGMDLFTPAGVLLKTVNATSGAIITLSSEAPVSGTYYAVIRSSNGNGGYYEFSEASVPTQQSTGALSSDQGVSGGIGGQLNTYTFAATAGGTIEVSAGPTGNSNGLEIGMDLFGPDGTLLDTINASRGYQIVTLSSTASSSGTYYVVIRSANGAGGGYNFSATAMPAQQVVDPLDNAGGPVVSGQGVGGSINGQLDAFTFNAAAGGTVELSAGPTGNSNGLEIGMDLFNPAGVLMRTINATTGYQIVTLTATALSTGTYTAVIRSVAGTYGSYEFSAAALPAAQSTGALASDQGASGYIGGNLNTYSISATAGGSVEVSAGPTGNSNGLEIGMDLFDPSGTLLKSINASRVYQIVTLATPADVSGTFYVVIRSANAAYGSYNFSAASAPAQQVPDPLDGAGGPVTSTQVISGGIGGQLDAFSFVASAGIVEATAYPTGNSNGLEIEVDLFDVNGTLVGSASATTGYQTVTVSALSTSSGTYTAIVRSANGAGGGFNFTATSNGSSPNPAFIDPTAGASYNATTNVLTVTGPTTIIADPGTLEPTILVNGSSGHLTIDPVAGGQVHIGALSVTNGASVSEISSLTAPVTVEIASGSTFFIDATSQYDIGRGNLVISNGSLTGITAALAAGSKSGAWTGYGIVSSAAANDTSHLTAVGAILNSYNGTTPIYSAFGSDPSVKSTDLLIKYTYYGDANLDGKVDGSDYSRIDSGELLRSTGWANGDFDYSGAVDGSDYTLIDNAFNTQGAQFEASLASQIVPVANTGNKRLNRSETESFAASTFFATGMPIEFPDLITFQADLKRSRLKHDLLDMLRFSTGSETG